MGMEPGVSREGAQPRGAPGLGEPPAEGEPSSRAPGPGPARGRRRGPRTDLRVGRQRGGPRACGVHGWGAAGPPGLGRSARLASAPAVRAANGGRGAPGVREELAPALQNPGGRGGVRAASPSGEGRCVPLTCVCVCGGWGWGGRVQFVWGPRDLSLQAKAFTFCQVAPPFPSFMSPSQPRCEPGAAVHRSRPGSGLREGIALSWGDLRLGELCVRAARPSLRSLCRIIG